ncbi:MAG: PspA/IM30 family protein [Omnitrophica WOR_2 bacterium]
MSILSRFTTMFRARANRAADQFEDPKASLDYSLIRLEESRVQLSRSLIEVSAAKNRLESQRDQLLSAVQKHQDQARKAVQAGREDLARIALDRMQEAEARQAELDNNITNLDRQAASLKQSQANLEHKIALFRSKKEELKAIYDSSRAQLQMREAVSGISADLTDVGNTIQRVEARIREMQSRSDAIEGLINEGVLTDVLAPENDDIDRELLHIHRVQVVEEELARLKAEAGMAELSGVQAPTLPVGEDRPDENHSLPAGEDR